MTEPPVGGVRLLMGAAVGRVYSTPPTYTKRTKMFDQMKQLLWGVEKQNETAIATGFDEVVIAIVKDMRNGTKPAKIDQHVIQHSLDLVQARGLSVSDLQATCDVLSKRYDWEPLSQQLDSLKQAAQAAEDAAVKHQRDEHERQQQAHRHQEQLDLATLRAQQAAERAMEARDGLIRTARVTDEERDLVAQLGKLNAQVATLDTQLRPHLLPHEAVAASWPNGSTHPGALLSAIKYALAKDKDDPANKGRGVHHTKAQLDEMKGNIKGLESRLKQLEQERTGLQKQIAALNVKLQAISAERLKPENFAIVRAQPTADELRRRQAQRLGYGSDLGVSIHAG